MLKLVKLIIAILFFSVSFSIHGQEDGSSRYIQLVKNKKNGKRNKNKKMQKKVEPPKYELTMCCITRDETEFLPEWIEFHLKQGIEHIYIYDNLTKDNLKDALHEYVQRGLIDIVHWPHEHHDDHSWGTVQLASYKHCIQRYGKESKWCAFIDTDEFLFCPDGKDLREFIKDYEDYQEVMVCWIIYGTSDVWQAPPGKLVQTLLLRGEDNFWLAMKPIVKPSDVTGIDSMHIFAVRDRNKIVDENYRQIDTIEGIYCPKVQSVNKIRLNHYVFRDKKFFEEVKIPRYIKRGVSREAAISFESVANKVYDDSILKCIR